MRTRSPSIHLSLIGCAFLLEVGLILANTADTGITGSNHHTAARHNMALLGKATASSEYGHSFPASAANDGDRYSCGKGQYWRGAKGEAPWTWQIDFGGPRRIAKVYQIMGSGPHIRHHTPTDYLWQWSNDLTSWKDIPGSALTGDTRIFRIVESATAVTARYFRIKIASATDDEPSLREIEMFANSTDQVRNDPWFYAANINASNELPSYAANFVPTARQCSEWGNVQAQFLWVKDFNESILQPEPRPLCAFLGGSIPDWCQRERSEFVGLEEVLRNRNLPLWGSCGGGQILLILEQHGTSLSWICPHCEWSRPDYYLTAPKPFIYGHIQCQGHTKCGEYKCVMEKGDYDLAKVLPDPVLSGLPDPFNLNESHMGELKWLPKSWVLIATKGSKGLTVNQIMRVRNRYIYAAQPHMENGGRDRLSLCKNFLDLAKSWGGYNPKGKDAPDPADRHNGLVIKK